MFSRLVQKNVNSLPMKKEDSIALSELLSTPKKIAIIPHRSPDGDAMGSSLGLYHYLKSKKHNVCVITPNSWPSFLDWMPGVSSCLVTPWDRLWRCIIFF